MHRSPFVFLLWIWGGSIASLLAFGMALLVILAILFALVGGGPGAQASAASACASQSATGIACQAVGWARAMSAHLHGSPDTFYDSGFPAPLVAYGKSICPGCTEWQNGHYQCVSYVLAAYAYIRPFPLAGNADQWWPEYSHQPGYVEIPAADLPGTSFPASLGQRGLPVPGDIMAWRGGILGHISVVLAVIPPQDTVSGSVTFGQANAQSPIQTLTLTPALLVDTHNGYWDGFTVEGYIRPI